MARRPPPRRTSSSSSDANVDSRNAYSSVVDGVLGRLDDVRIEHAQGSPDRLSEAVCDMIRRVVVDKENHSVMLLGDRFDQKEKAIRMAMQRLGDSREFCKVVYLNGKIHGESEANAVK